MAREETPRAFVDDEDQDVRSQMVRLLPRLRHFAIALTGSMADGDDLAQDTVERALKALHQWERGTRLDSWMFKIAKNRFIDARRSARRSGEVLMDAPDEAGAQASADGAGAAEARLTLQKVLGAMASLPQEQREVVALVLIDGRSYREAADILGTPIGTVTSRISRARETLASLVEA